MLYHSLKYHTGAVVVFAYLGAAVWMSISKNSVHALVVGVLLQKFGNDKLRLRIYAAHGGDYPKLVSDSHFSAFAPVYADSAGFACA